MSFPPSANPEKFTEKRAVQSARRRRQLLLLVASYAELQPKFPELRQEIQTHMDGLLQQADRTRESDRRAVMESLRQWQSTGLSVEDLCDDTSLSAWTVRLIIDELQQASPPLVGFRERVQDRERGRRIRIYFLLDPSPKDISN